MCRSCSAASSRRPTTSRRPRRSPASRTSANSTRSRPSASSSASRSSPTSWNPFFPVNTLNLMRAAIAAQLEGVFEKYVEAAFHHMWREPKKMDDPEVAAKALASSGLDAQKLFARAAGPRGEGQTDREHRRRRSSAARSARRPSSSATRCSSARSSCARSRRWCRGSDFLEVGKSNNLLDVVRRKPGPITTE